MLAGRMSFSVIMPLCVQHPDVDGTRYYGKFAVDVIYRVVRRNVLARYGIFHPYFQAVFARVFHVLYVHFAALDKVRYFVVSRVTAFAVDGDYKARIFGMNLSVVIPACTVRVAYKRAGIYCDFAVSTVEIVVGRNVFAVLIGYGKFQNIFVLVRVDFACIPCNRNGVPRRFERGARTFGQRKFFVGFFAAVVSCGQIGSSYNESTRRYVEIVIGSDLYPAVFRLPVNSEIYLVVVLARRSLKDPDVHLFGIAVGKGRFTADFVPLVRDMRVFLSVVINRIGRYRNFYSALYKSNIRRRGDEIVRVRNVVSVRVVCGYGGSDGLCRGVFRRIIGIYKLRAGYSVRIEKLGFNRRKFAVNYRRTVRSNGYRARKHGERVHFAVSGLASDIVRHGPDKVCAGAGGLFVRPDVGIFRAELVRNRIEYCARTV